MSLSDCHDTHSEFKFTSFDLFIKILLSLLFAFKAIILKEQKLQKLWHPRKQSLQNYAQRKFI